MTDAEKSVAKKYKIKKSGLDGSTTGAMITYIFFIALKHFTQVPPLDVRSI
jgi:hypothetical protein